jgi:hypothetical protein
MKTKVVAFMLLNASWWRGFSAGHKAKWAIVKRLLRRRLKRAVQGSGVKVVLEMDAFALLKADRPYEMDFESDDDGRPLTDDEAQAMGIEWPPNTVRTRIGECVRDIIKLPYVPR